MRYLLGHGRKNSPTPYYTLAVIIFIVIITMNLYLIRLVTTDKANPVELANASGPSITEPLPENLLSVEMVRGLASTDSPNYEITSIQLEQRSGQLVYLVTLSSGKKLTFDAQSGARVNDVSHNGLPQDKVLPASIDSSVDFEMAREIAKGDKPDGQIEKIELGQEGDAVIYSVYFTDGSRTDVSSEGVILRKESAPAPETPIDVPTNLPPAVEPPLPTDGNEIPSFLETPGTIDSEYTNPD